jgi:cell division protein FtsQ
MNIPKNWKSILWSICWVFTGIAVIFLFGASLQKKNNKKCTGVKIEITGAEKHLFIDEKDVMDLLNANGQVAGKPIHLLNLRQMETLVEQNKWVKNAEMFINNNQVLQINIEERQPVARIFQTNGNSYYLDTASVFLPLSNKLSARVPIFTGLVEMKTIDSSLIKQVIDLAKYITQDSFYSAQISQINIRPDKQFELIPLIGDQIIVFGDASDLAAKFNKLKAFYKSAWLQNGMNTYETLDVQYKNQVLAIKRGTAKAVADSATAMALLKNGAMFLPLLDSTASKPIDSIKIKQAKTTKISKPKNNKRNQKPLRT